MFVNYRTGDGDWAATLIARELATRFGAHNVFLASKSIRLGEDFAERIEARLRECDVLLAVIGTRWPAITDRAGRPRIDDPDDWVNREIIAALKHGLRVIPVLLDRVPRLDESDLPLSIARLARCQYLRLHHRNDDRDIARLLDELDELVPGLQEPRPAPERPEDDLAQCPYRGLQPFREEDAEVFHGRDREIARLTRLVAHRPVVVVAGASGSGKSSLVRAGLWPVLRREEAALAVFRPIAGVSPNALLMNALRTVLGPGLHDRLDDRDGDLALLADPIAEEVGELVLCVDQFEELAGTDPAAARELFDLVAELVHAAPRRPGRPPALRAVFTMRSAGVDEVLTAELAAVLEESTVYVRAMGPAELRAAIAEPLAATGHVEFEPGLVERIVGDAEGAPGQLPLVEFALTRLWESRRGGLLTHEAYDEMGGVGGALAAYAEEFYTERLPEARRPFAERLLVQLARPGEDGSFRFAPALLDRLPPELRETAAELGYSRLVVIRQDVGQPEVVALAHEALVHAWRRLHDWLVAAQEFRTWQEQLRVTLGQWQVSDRDSGGLLRGAPLATAELWLAAGPDDLTAAEREYVVASRRHRLRGVRRWRAVTALVAALALATSVLSAVVVQRSDELGDQLRDANATLLAQEAKRAAEDHPSTALQFALAAWREKPGNSGAYEALLDQYLKWRFAERIHGPEEGGPLSRSQASTDGRVRAALVGEGQHRVVVWDGPPERSRRWVPTTEEAASFAVSPDGSSLAISTFDGAVLLWTIADRAGPFPLRQKGSGSPPATLRFDADGRFLAENIDLKRVEVWDVRKRRPLPTAIGSKASLNDAVPLRGGDAVATQTGALGASEVVVRDRRTGEKLRDFPKGSIPLGAGSDVAVCEPAGLRIRDARTGADRTPSPAPPPCNGGTPFVPDATGQFLCVVGSCGTSGVGMYTFLHWPTGRRYTIRAPLPFEAETAGAVGMLDAGGGMTMAVHNGDTFAQVRAAKPDPPDEGKRSPFVTAPAFDPEHRRWLSARENDDLVLTDADTGRRLAEVPGKHHEPNLVFTPSGDRALSGAGGELRIYRVPDLSVEREIRVRDAPATSRPEVVALSDDEAAFLQDGVLTRWNLDTGRPVAGPLPLDEGSNDQVGIHARPGHPGQIVADTEAGVDVWDVGKRSRIVHLKGEVKAGGWQAIALNPGGTRLAGVSRARGEVEVWDVDESRALPSIPSQALNVVGFAGPMLLLSDVSGKIQFWRWERAELVATVTVPGLVGRWSWLHGDELSYLELDAPVASVRSLRFDPGEWFARLCEEGDRAFTQREKDRLPSTVSRDRPCSH
ncbi:TIR domain-containing protein [Spirillospora sp. CA-142024]|uniref:nSTAND1 domain-containing NTPase n=1 Tax=Spirillospora sp. CA-142024 TaxID=3240036 RepID=UPI003D8F2EFA